jgi:FG-GAP repeat/Tetratricopeptide repeat
MNKHSFKLISAAVAMIALLHSPILLTAQSGPAEEVRKAQALVRAKDYDGAIKILEEFLKAQGNQPRPGAWNVLANAYHLKGDYDRALQAYAKAMTSPQFAPQSRYNSACLYALKNEKEEAFKLLQQLRESGRFDMSLILSDDDLKSLRSDPRFAKLIPRPEEFADPFVENVKIIREWTGEAKGDQFGWIARRIGDVDGDRVDDVVTSAPTHLIEGKPAGRVYVYSGKTGKLLWTQTGPSGGRLGIGIEAAGDVNKDGVPDVIASAPGAGKAYVYSGKDGRVLLTLGAGDPGEGFGRHVSGTGDINGDGYSDVIVGAPNNNAAGQGAGRVYVYSGKDGSVLLTLDGERAGDAYGSSVAGYKDKRYAFVIVGAPNAGARNGGRVYVYTGLTNKPTFTIEADETGAQLGAMFLSVVGDVNRDKVPDIYASDFSNNAKGNSTGRIYVVSGVDGRRLLTLTGESANDGFGIGPADAGDVNHDGYDDLIVGAWQHSSAAASGGKVYLYSGKDGSLMRAFTCRIPGDTFGFDATQIGDVDGDGAIDFLLTSAWSGINGFQSGRVFIISGKN